MPMPRLCAALFVASLITLPLIAQEPTPKTPAVAVPLKADEADPSLIDLLIGTNGYQDRPFAKGEYKYLRTAYAKYFAAKYDDVLKSKLGDDAEPLYAFLNANTELRETLFTAIDPVLDNPANVMSVVRDLWKAEPAAVKANDELTVAVAVVWDSPRGPYDYRHHQERVRAKLPEAVKNVGAIDNFKYYLTHTAKLKGPQMQLPWEFLVHTINHHTPVDERDWAVTNYLKTRPGIGSCYKDIVYDDKMLQTQGAVCKLGGKPYTLASIKQYGGVCAMQADFAARVAKSLGVPAEYVGGEGNTGGRHAWVMWVEVKAVQKDTVTFTLESYGRYNLDRYYIGTLDDAKTGKEVTDRDLERRLTAVGNAPNFSRQADLLMRAYPLVRESKMLNTKMQLAYLNRVLALYPMCEAAWLELAALHRDGKLTDWVEATRLVDKTLVTFAKFPDFSWKLVPDLLVAQKEKLYRTRTYEKMALAYEQLGRPDLACEARLKLVEYQAEAKEHLRAFNGLAGTVRKFLDEGRYIGKMISKMQEMAKEFKGGDAMMAKFYLEILPRIPTRRGDMLSTFCVTVHEEAITYLKDTKHPKEATIAEQSLARAKSGRGL